MTSQPQTPAEVPTTEEEWRARLSPAEFRVLRRAGTEPAFTGEYVNTKTQGRYRCRGCGAELFSSDTKFESHCGWPSFDEAIPGPSHLGHVFYGEGFTPKDTRYCINSISMRLEPTQ
jgi:peptide-methionine (R)-S-oxide reductase